MQPRRPTPALILAGIVFFLTIGLFGCGQTLTPATVEQKPLKTTDGIIRSSDRYAVGITTDQKIYTRTTTSSLAVKLLSQGASPTTPFNGTQLFIQVPPGIVLSKIESSDPNMTAKPPKDEGNNVFQILLYGGNQTSDIKDGFATLTLTINNPSVTGEVRIVNKDNRLSTITGDQNTDAHAIPSGEILCSIQ